jgi:hypothetical protein
MNELAIFAPLGTTTTVEWTAYGLLATVLSAVGAFLAWYIPAHDKTTRDQMHHLQEQFERRISEQQTLFAESLIRVHEQHRLQLERERSVFAETVTLERAHHHQLLDHVCEQFQRANTANLQATGELRDAIETLADRLRPLPTKASA